MERDAPSDLSYENLHHTTQQPNRFTMVHTNSHTRERWQDQKWEKEESTKS